MHEFDASAMENQRASRKGKERDLGGGDPQPTDIADKIIAMRRRAAGNTKPRERAERPAAAPPPSTPRADRSPAQRTVNSPRKANAPAQGMVSRGAPEADPDEFSRRLKITSSPSPRMAQSTPKLYDPERDPIPVMRRTAEPEQMADTSRGAQRDAAPMRQLFNHRKDDPVRFSVMARPQQAGGRGTPAPKNSADYSSTSAASSYAASQTSSSFTLSSTTDGSSASSALFEGQKKSTEEGSNLAIQLKKLYRTITHLESKVNEADQNEEAEDTSRVRIKPKGPDSEEVEIEKWKKRLESHKRCVLRFFP
ncbi:hypothetical protein CYLTODRAFT_76393 [Cylindrobasidium torrendii FP15055 ss-10]|uniref:Uncharacterized protein n=1 Tax=Cylindrobasidium torrendii FP15055 ss-10 TaxID=1314674 RepID=A0A0D7B671_9AGAR|nr:hypothetical protein CYLTODRAFT_76393 [Cylindrobasidium torrendii FP15055 ss-10]